MTKSTRVGLSLSSCAVMVLLAATQIAGQTAAAPGRAAADLDMTPQGLARTWDAEHVSPPLPPLVDHADVVRRLSGIADAWPGLVAVEKIGESLEGRSINHVTAGSGPFAVLLWSQMHGDEPTATSALFDVFDFVGRHREDPAVRRILSRLTLHVVPMLNPDGAERFQRRNMQGIDINRDALRLQTAEGRILKALRDRIRPAIGFNLHNQSWRTSVGDPPMPASISLLSVAYDKPRTENAGRTLTKKICAVIRDSLEPLASSQIGRYDDEFEVRAFGDNITLWGTPVVLIETGPWPSAEPDAALVRLNFVAILSSLHALATGSVERADPRRYETLPMNESKEMYVLVKNGTIISGAGVPPFVGDVGIVANRRVRTVAGRRELQTATTIEDIGDLRTLGGLRTIDAAGMTLVPIGTAPLQPGQTVDLPDWRAKSEATIAVGQPARIAILKPTNDGRYIVEVVLSSES
jgi:hypothetical protein